MIILNLERKIESKFNIIAQNYNGNYNSLFGDFLKYYLSQLKKGVKNIELDMIYFENKYSMKSKQFYNLFSHGKLGDETDYMQWSGEYEIWLDYKRRLKELSK